jgi:glutathione S-transferase
VLECIMTATIELFWMPGTCARVPLIALEEIGIPFETRLALPYDREGWAAYRRDVNPKGKVPALRVDGRVITENLVIQTYLARRHPEARLLPEDPDTQLEALTLQSWLASGIHPAITRFRFPVFFCDLPESHGRIREIARTTLAESFSLIEARLEDRPWILGDAWTILDGYLLWAFFRSVGSGLDPSPFPRTCDHARRCEQRPSVARALDLEESTFARLREEGRMPPVLATAPAAVGRVPLR